MNVHMFCGVFTIIDLSSHNNLHFFLSSLQTHISIKSSRSFHDNPTLKSQSIIKTTFALLSLKSQQFAHFYKITIFAIQTHTSFQSFHVMPSNSLFQMTTWCSWMVVAMETWCGSGMDFVTMVGMHTWYHCLSMVFVGFHNLLFSVGILVAQVSHILHL